MKKFLLILLVAPFMGSVQANAQGGCQANYQMDVSNCPQISFSDVSYVDSMDQVVSWGWDFGDGNTSTSANPSNSYASEGWYLICITIQTSGGCSSTICDSVLIDCGTQSNCEADFYSVVDSSGNCSTIDFYDMSTSNTSINEWSYDFGDGSASTSQNPSHTYLNDGVYVVCLSITAADSCVATFCETVVIDCNGQLNCEADFYTVVDSSGNCSTIDFYDMSTSSTSINEWVYDFGDGSSSTSQNPSHTYSMNGTYVVCITTTAADSCVATYCETIVIDCILGLKETQLDGLTLSPNPAQETIQLNLKQSNNIEYQIIGLNGAVYQQGERSSASNHAFEIYNLDAGMYLLKLKVEDEVQVIRFIKE